jgi:hypothetical protein
MGHAAAEDFAPKNPPDAEKQGKAEWPRWVCG